MPLLGEVDPRSDARVYMQLRCSQPGCAWDWKGYLPREDSARAVAERPIIEDHFRHEHPEVSV